LLLQGRATAQQHGAAQGDEFRICAFHAISYFPFLAFLKTFFYPDAPNYRPSRI
jgi:hypothetical protein